MWDVDSCELIYKLDSHKNAILTMTLIGGQLYTGGYDSVIYSWDLEEMQERIEETKMMRQAHIES